MGELIGFPGKRNESKSEDATTFRIPSMELLYAEDRITLAGDTVTVADLKRRMLATSRTNALHNLESTLAQERGDFIVANSRTKSSRTEALVGLAKHEYAVGRQIDHPELMDWARGELIRGLGMRRAMAVIENIVLKDGVSDSNS